MAVCGIFDVFSRGYTGIGQFLRWYSYLYADAFSQDFQLKFCEINWNWICEILNFINKCLLKNNGIKERISFYCASNNCGREESIFKVSVGSNFPQLVFCICKNWKNPTKAVEGLHKYNLIAALY